MQLSFFIGKLFGIYFLIYGLAIFANREKVTKILAESLKKPAIGLYGGLFGTALGLFLILVHNIWTFSWPVVITLICWWIFIKGMICLFFWDKSIKLWQKFLGKRSLEISALIIIILGLYLLYSVYFF